MVLPALLVLPVLMEPMVRRGLLGRPAPLVLTLRCLVLLGLLARRARSVRLVRLA